MKPFILYQRYYTFLGYTQVVHMYNGPEMILFFQCKFLKMSKKPAFHSYTFLMHFKCITSLGNNSKDFCTHFNAHYEIIHGIKLFKWHWCIRIYIKLNSTYISGKNIHQHMQSRNTVGFYGFLFCFMCLYIKIYQKLSWALWAVFCKPIMA